MKEQNLPRSLEFDGLDSSALHWLVLTREEEPIGTLRLLPGGQIGRMAVLHAFFCPSGGGGRKGDVSRFVEDAVPAQILELSAEQAKSANAHLSESELTQAIDEALVWARKR